MPRKYRDYMVEVLEYLPGQPRLGLVELVGPVLVEIGTRETRKEEAHDAVVAVASGRYRSNYGANVHRYGYRAYEQGMAGKYPDREVHVDPPVMPKKGGVR